MLRVTIEIYRVARGGSTVKLEKGYRDVMESLAMDPDNESHVIAFAKSMAPRDWHWRMTTRKGRIIGASTEGYRRVGDCLKNLCAVTDIHVVRKIDMFKKPRGVLGLVKGEETHVITGRIQAPLKFQHTFLWR